MNQSPIQTFLFEGEWYIAMEAQGHQFTTGPFQSKEDAEEWYQANQTKQCPNCED